MLAEEAAPAQPGAKMESGILDGIFSPINLIFLALAVAVLLRLRAVLGRRTGHERPPPDAGVFAGKAEKKRQDGARVESAEGAQTAQEAVAPAESGKSTPDEALKRGVRQIALADRSFDPGHFMDGARIAYEAIVSGFAAGDRNKLGVLLGEEAYQRFDAVIRGREKRGESASCEVVAIHESRYVDASMRGLHARITVQFHAELLSFVRDREGNVIEGDDKLPHRCEDIWTFERNTRDDNPNWQLVKTGGVQDGQAHP